MPDESYTIEVMNDHPLVKELMANSFGHEDGFIKLQPSGFFLPAVYKDHIDRIKSFEIRDDDIWICTFPKCGTTWTQEMVWCLMNNLNYDTARKVDLDERVVFFELTAILKAQANSFMNIDTIAISASLPSPRILKTHLPFCLLPDQLRDGSKKAKVIYITRSSPDVCLSFYNHFRLLEGYTGSFELWVDLFLEGLSGYYTPYYQHVAEWVTEDLSKHKVLFLKYEEMKADLASVVRKVAGFIGAEISEDKMGGLLDHLSFENFQNTPSLNKTKLIGMIEAMDPKSVEKGGVFCRNGKVGEGKKRLTEEMAEKFAKKEEELFEKTGYKLGL